VSCIDRSIRASRVPAVTALALWLAGCAITLPTLTPPAQRPGTGAATPGAAAAARSWEDYRIQAARRIVAANPQISHTGTVQEPLLAIPVLEVELNQDGSVLNIVVLREPSQAKDTTRIAIDAVRRAGPFGDVTRLPKPWRFSEAFLFNDDRRFKPRSLD
jgi:hypothetical protein